MSLVVAETERMKNSTKSFDVFDFTAEDELDEITVKKYAPKSGYPHARDVSRNEIQSKEIGVGICGGTNADIDYNPDTIGLLTPIATEDFAKEGLDLSHDMHHDFMNREQAEEINSKIIESSGLFASAECGSSVGATVQLKDNLNIDFQHSSCNDMSGHLAADADESMSERSPSAIAINSASSDGPLTGNWSSDWNLGDERAGVELYPDYVDYCGTHYLDSVVNFSKRFVEARSINIRGDERTFHIHLEFEDIINIDSQWSARYKTGIINIKFIPKDGMRDDIIHNASAPGLQQFKFPIIDSNWYQKQEAIISLDVRYKALWNVLLDAGSENISPLSDGKTIMRKRSYFPKFDKPFEDVIYPKGDPDAVSISKRDVDLLLPETFVNDTIIDFYIKYLKSRTNAEERTKFHFFNSFFFRKLADMDKDPSSAFDGKAAFLRVRKWTRKINLLEKDFIFIPVNYNYHWSLIVICYFGEVASYKDDDDGNSLKVPCILHMDSLVGNHVGLKDLLQSYLWEEWKERHKETSEDLHSNFKNLKFIPLELPQQQNSYDCGLFLLHYVERFLEEVPANFNIYQITSSSNFLQADWFPPSVASMKRTCIERLINDLLETQSEECTFGGNEMHCSPEGLKATHGYDNGVKFSIISSPMNAFCESSLHQVDQEIEMNLLPASSTRNTNCNRTSGLVLKELFKQASVPEPSWKALGRRASLSEEDVEETNDCFVQEELLEHVFHHIDGVTIDRPVFPYSSRDLRLNSLHQLTPDQFVSSSPDTSVSDSDDIIEVGADDDEKRQPVEAVTVNHQESVEEINGCFEQEGLLEPVFHHIDDVTIDEPVFPCSPGHFRLNPLHQIMPDHKLSSSPLTSGSDSDDDMVKAEADDGGKWKPAEAVAVNHNEPACHRYSSPEKKTEHPNAKISRTPFEINKLIIADKSFSCKGFCQEETNQLQHDHGPADEGLSVGPAGNESGVVLENVISCGEVCLDSDGHELVLEEQRSAKLVLEPVFHHIDDVTIDEPVFPCSPGHFRLNPLHQIMPDHKLSSSPVTSGSDSDDGMVKAEADGGKWKPAVNHNEPDCHRYLSPEKKTEHPNAKISRTPFEIKELIIVDKSFSCKGFCQEETNQLQYDHDPADEGLSVGPAGNESGIVLENVVSCGEVCLDSDGHELVSEEQRSAKRMRVGPWEGE